MKEVMGQDIVDRWPTRWITVEDAGNETLTLVRDTDMFGE